MCPNSGMIKHSGQAGGQNPTYKGNSDVRKSAKEEEIPETESLKSWK